MLSERISSTVSLSVVLLNSKTTLSESASLPKFKNDDAATTQPIKISARITPNINFLACSLIYLPPVYVSIKFCINHDDMLISDDNVSISSGLNHFAFSISSPST